MHAVPKILDSVGRITGMRFVAIARVRTGNWVCCAVRDPTNFGLPLGGELRIEKTTGRKTSEHSEVVVINDVQTDGAYCNHPSSEQYGFRSYIAAPIKLVDGAVWGMLCALDPEPRDLDRPEVISTFELFGELIAAQLSMNARFEQSQSDLSIRESSLRKSEHGRMSAEESLRLSQADLVDERRTAELREQFIGVLGHDLRNPLASIDAGLRILLRDIDDGRSQAIITEMQKSVLRMAGLVDNIMDFARGRLGGGLTIKPDARQSLTPVLEGVVNEVRLAWPDRKIETVIEIKEPVRCDRSKLGQLFSNLLGNAITYGDPAMAVMVTAWTNEAEFALTVTNYGTPISDKAMTHLFQPYTRGDRPSQNGLGLGLYISSEIARAHSGKLDAVSTPNETTFTFKMPL
ncbi:GAF domain-containing sensor histidine kinase [Bradyrhizobium sp. 14AA]